MSVTLFEPCLVDVGDPPIRVRGQKITCGRCNATYKTNMNSMKAVYDNGEHIERLCIRRFEQAGWHVAKRPGQHRCPVCVKLSRTENAFSKLETLRSPREEKRAAADALFFPLVPKPEPEPEPAPAAAPVNGHAPVELPTEQTPDHSRAIYTAISRVYEDHAYKGDWTDERIAAKLKVPVKWVIQTRAHLFGPAKPHVNTDFMKQLAEIERVIDQCSKLTERTEATAKQMVAHLSAEIEPVRAIMQQALATIEVIRKAVAP